MLSLLNKAKFLLSGNIFFAFSQWLILIFLSHFTDSRTVGEYTYALALVGPIFMLTNLQLRPLVVVEYNLKNNFIFEKYFSLRFYSVFFGIILSIFFSIFSSSNVYISIFIISLIKALEGISDIIYAYYNAQGKTKKISVSLAIKSCLVISLFPLLLFIFNSLYISLVAIIFIYLLVLVFIDFKNINLKKSFFKIDLIKCKEIIILAFPLGMSVMLIALQNSIPRFFLEKSYHLEVVGIFSLFYYFVIVGGIVINSICQFLSPKFSIYYRDSNISKLIKIAIQSWSFAIFLGISGLVVSEMFGKILVGIIYGSEYLSYINILKIIMIAGLFTYLSVVNGYFMTSLGLIKIQLPLFIVLTVLTFMLSWILIPSSGLVGAAWVYVCSALFQFILSGIILYIKLVKL